MDLNSLKPPSLFVHPVHFFLFSLYLKILNISLYLDIAERLAEGYHFCIWMRIYLILHHFMKSQCRRVSGCWEYPRSPRAKWNNTNGCLTSPWAYCAWSGSGQGDLSSVSLSHCCLCCHSTTRIFENMLMFLPGKKIERIIQRLKEREREFPVCFRGYSILSHPLIVPFKPKHKLPLAQGGCIYPSI